MKMAAVLNLILVALTSLWAFAAYGIDKRRAQIGSSRRVPESRLHLLALVGDPVVAEIHAIRQNVA